jgi:DNA-binding transcriptional ArsR family regulator
MDSRRDVFQAIADPTRRAIILLLAANALTPNAIASHFNTSRQAVSKHLQILAECDLVKQEVQGRSIQYHINKAPMEAIEKWIEQFQSIFESRFEQLDQVLHKLKSQKK